jgi:hypothetical protein
MMSGGTQPLPERPVGTLLVSAMLLLGLSSAGSAAPALGDKPPKWEYAELTFRTMPGRSAGTDDDGKEIPAVPASVSINWVTGAGEVEVKGWHELAEKLRATGFKKGSASFQRIQILNYLGADGWELMEQETTTTVNAGRGGLAGAPGGGAGGSRGGAGGVPAVSVSPGPSTWLLKRRVP